MKRILSYLLAVTLFMLCLTSCGGDNGNVADSENNEKSIKTGTSSQTVPERLIEAQVNQYQSWFNNNYGNCDSIICNRIISHSPDKESHTDTVNYEIGFCYQFGAVIFECVDIFQYNKDSDNWVYLNSREPTLLRSEWDKDAIIGANTDGNDSLKKIFSGNDEDWTWDIAIGDIDFDSGIIVLNYHIENDIYDANGDFICNFNWNSTEEFNFSTHNGNGTGADEIVTDIPCEYTTNGNSFDCVIRINLTLSQLSSGLVDW